MWGGGVGGRGGEVVIFQTIIQVVFMANQLLQIGVILDRHLMKPCKVCNCDKVVQLGEAFLVKDDLLKYCWG